MNSTTPLQDQAKNQSQELSPDIITALNQSSIDIPYTTHMLAQLNKSNAAIPTPTTRSSFHIPSSGHPNILNLDSTPGVNIAADTARSRLEYLLSPLGAQTFWNSYVTHGATQTHPPEAHLSIAALRQLGYLLYPQVAFGILNGGSATSYIDITKNTRLAPDLFQSLQGTFNQVASRIGNSPKAVCPALIGTHNNSDTFLGMKLRHLLIEGIRARAHGAQCHAIPLFQMTSQFTHEPIITAIQEYYQHPQIASLLDQGVTIPWENYIATQKLLPALRRQDNRQDKRQDKRQDNQYTIFTTPDGRVRGLPGGHGQNFSVLQSIYRQLHHQGIRFVFLGNIDNLGYTLDPISLALCALFNAPALFEFATRTPLDIKGGILAQHKTHLCNAEIGIDIALPEVLEHERGGGTTLFNCAIGLFNLDALIPQLDTIIETMPYRLNFQQNDFGSYWQAEQITWELIGMLDSPLIRVVKKQERFLAAKMLLETLLMSGFGNRNNSATAAMLNDGAQLAAQHYYGYRWHGTHGQLDSLTPLNVDQILKGSA